MPVTADESDSWHNHVVISEILVSASSEDYDGVDWNGDGDIGSFSDQYIELWNPTDQTVNISNWVLDDLLGAGSPSCSIGWNTELAPDARLAFFRDNTRIELDYWDGDTVNLLDDQGNLVHSMSYPGEDSYWDVPYTLLENGSYWKDYDGPSPGADVPANWTGPSVGGSCYTISDTQHKGAYILTGRIVTMASEPKGLEDHGNSAVLLYHLHLAKVCVGIEWRPRLVAHKRARHEVRRTRARQFKYA